jgi:hypothetical protein
MLLDRPHFQVKLHQDSLEVNLKEGVRRDIEKLAESKPILQETLGWVFQTIIPLNVRLWEIERVEVEDTGKINLVIPHRRDLHIPLELSDAKRLAEKLNQMIPGEKAKEMERVRNYDMAQREHDRERDDALHFPRRPA